MKKLIIFAALSLIAFPGCDVLKQLTTIPPVTTPHSNLQVQIQKCERVGRDVYLEFLLVNKGPEIGYKFPELANPNPAVDNLGNQYRALCSGNFIFTLATNVPNKVVFRISDVATDATSFPMIKFMGETDPANGSYRPTGEFEFRDVAINF